MFILSALLSMVCVFGAAYAWEPKCDSLGFQIIPKPDCSEFYFCVFGKPIAMPNCPPGSIFSSSAPVCVPENSIYNDCKDDNGDRPIIPDLDQLTIEEQCQIHSNALIPHPTECQAYYNCSMVYKHIPILFEQHLMECPYPEHFNAETKQCEHFENVKCRTRQAAVNGCDYRRYRCTYSHCIPCSYTMPSCEDKEDGMNVDGNRLWKPYYVICYKGRFVSSETCEADSKGRTQFFHPDKNQCVPLDEIPREHGGQMPDCVGKKDGNYPYNFGGCDSFAVCKDGQFLNSVHCNAGEVFDTFVENCVLKEMACGPCGDLINC
ncbi:chitin binding [Mactra antiquata]